VQCAHCSFLPGALSATVVASESIDGETQVSYLNSEIYAREEQHDRKLENEIPLRADNQKLKEELMAAYKKLEKADGDNTSFSQRVAELESDNTTLQNDIARIQQEKLLYEQEHQKDTSCLRNDALHNLPDSARNDLDAHIKTCKTSVYFNIPLPLI
jgi:predicted RNase H-like nuclease (RuvC/YqgF family)